MHQELENQIAQLKKQNEILRLNFSIQNLEKEKRAAEFKIAATELEYQNLEKEKRAAELKIANIELDHQNREKEKRSAELKIANIELEHQSEEKEKRAAELIIASIELEFQSREKEKRADELRIANIELKYQSEEKKKRAAELKIAKRELEYQNEAKEERAAELIIANLELVFQNEEKAKRAAELLISKIKVAQQSKENEKLAEELTIANFAVALQSELIIAKEKAEKNEIQLRELNATKDKMFSIIAHDLRSPLNSILGFSELLLENQKNQEFEENQQFLEIVRLSAKNTITLLDNLLNWAKSQVGQINFTPERLVLSAIIADVFALSNSTSNNKNISLNYIESEPITIFADQNIINVVLRNLLSNALKFTNENGNITVAAVHHDKYVEITVSDNGVGIDAATQNNLFKLETNIGSAKYTNSGLGLILCKEFVERHGGTIWVESELGKGSHFKFTLPSETSA
ncbi:HAMP domain-containing sensor histidine kinase [Flavobacterium antarcticum]|uniref:ATP-binding protein n=1 Tax=Flavobacterium antarcticum TaxID=271155 RepID=UPI0003B69E9B|nr:HAMP domain-containing sensor histidine kinase [Flavobacterium antarcticum]